MVRNKITQIKINLRIQRQTITELKEQLEKCYVDLDIHFDPEIVERYQSFIEAFKTLTQSHKIWHIIDSRKISRTEMIQTRTSVNRQLNRVEVTFGIQSLPEIKTGYEVLWLQNRNGHDLYFYPNFLVIYSTQDKYAIIDYNDLQVIYNCVTFIETDPVPQDSKITRYTWQKVNKDGTPDRRCKNNYQIPIVAYGQLFITTSTGIQEEYQCSNNEFTEKFVAAYSKYRMSLNAV